MSAVVAAGLTAGPDRAVAAVVAAGVGSLSPTSGPGMGGTVVLVSGTGFGDVTEVWFGGKPSDSVTVRSDTELTAVAPSGTGTVDVTIRSGDTVGAGTAQFRYQPGSRFRALTPTRVLDTRDGTGGRLGPLGGGQMLDLDLSAKVPADATAVVLNVTGTESTAATYVTAWPAAEPKPLASNVNLVAGQTAPNLVTVAVSAAKVKLFNNNGSVHLIADLAGYYGPTAPDLFTALAPWRALDSRDGTGGRLGALGPADVIELDLSAKVPADATAVVLNVTGTAPTTATYVTAWPAAEPKPLASNVNLVAGQTAPNLVTVAVSAAKVKLFNNNG
ncbi:MAG TPA: IPT/TIG domain-containing protein, partial [Actinokineospora sp.]|nr:IPT/TIG domain-containing protein [Actinokineospora sp.]